MARLLLGVSGGIAAYKAIELVRLAIKAGHSVRVIQTEASTRFVGTRRADSSASATRASSASTPFEVCVRSSLYAATASCFLPSAFIVTGGRGRFEGATGSGTFTGRAEGADKNTGTYQGVVSRPKP